MLSAVSGLMSHHLYRYRLCIFEFLTQLNGYVVQFDMRDPTTLVLRLMISWFFGAGDPGTEPSPLCVGGHMADHHRESDEIRAYVHYGDTVKVTLPADAVKESTQLPRFGHKKCTTGDTPARWVHMEKQACAPPLCTGNRTGTVNNIDSVCALNQAGMFLSPIEVHWLPVCVSAASRAGFSTFDGCHDVMMYTDISIF